MPLAWLRRSRVLATVCLIGFLATLLVSASMLEGDLAVLVVFFCGCMLIAMRLVVRQRNLFPEMGPVFSFIGFFVYLTILFVLSFHHRSRGTWSVDFDQFMQSLFFFSFALAAIGAWAWAIWPTARRKAQPGSVISSQYYGVWATLTIMILNTLHLLPLGGWLGMAIFNILFLYQCIIMIVSGCKTHNLKTTVTGCMLFAIIAMTRYTDLFFSLLMRSLVFFIAGAALFSVGLYYSRTRKQIDRETP
jgi:hypothetical protein